MDRPRTLTTPADGVVQILETRRGSAIPVAEPARTRWRRIVFEHEQRPAAPVSRPSWRRPGRANALGSFPTASTPHDLSLATVRATPAGLGWTPLPSRSPAAAAKAATDASDSCR